MITFLDGPAHGQVLELQRVPMMLRLVYDWRTERWDALDQLGDVPDPQEVIHVYRLAGSVGKFHVCCYPPADSRWINSAEYRYLERVPDDQVRETSSWAHWCEANRSRLLADAAPAAVRELEPRR